MAVPVPGLSLFSKTMRPRKRRSDSTSSLRPQVKSRISKGWLDHVSLRRLPLQSLCLDPGQRGNALGSNSDDAVPMSRVVLEDLGVIFRYYRGVSQSQLRPCLPLSDLGGHLRDSFVQMSSMTSGAPLT